MIVAPGTDLHSRPTAIPHSRQTGTSRRECPGGDPSLARASGRPKEGDRGSREGLGAPMSLLTDECYEFGGYRLNLTQRTLTHAGQAVPLPPKAFELLLLLVKSSGRAFSKRELMAALWPDTFVEEANLAFQISVLRKVLGDSGARWIETVPKYGYRFTADVRVASSVDRRNDASASDARPETISFRRWHASGPTKWLMAIAPVSALAVAVYVIASTSRTPAPTATSITASTGSRSHLRFRQTSARSPFHGDCLAPEVRGISMSRRLDLKNPAA